MNFEPHSLVNIGEKTVKWSKDSGYLNIYNQFSDNWTHSYQ